MPVRYFQFEPTQYQSQFDPTPANILQGALGRQQQRFDLAQQELAQFDTELGQVPFLDPEARQEFEGRLETELDDIYERYSGDLGAARNEITRTLGRFRRDPYLNLSRRQIEQAQLFEQARARDPRNFIGIQDPRAVRLQDVTDPSQVEAQFDIRTDYTKDISTNFASVGQNAIDFVRTKASRLGPQYFEKVRRKGLGVLTDKELNSLITDQDVENFKARTTFDIDPNLEGTDAKRFIIETLDSVFGTQQESQFIRNLDYLDAKSRTRLTKQPPTQYLTTTAKNAASGSIFDGGVTVDKKGQVEDDPKIRYDSEGNIITKSKAQPLTAVGQLRGLQVEGEVTNQNAVDRKKVLDNYRTNLGIDENTTDKQLNDILIKAEDKFSKQGIRYERFPKKVTNEITQNVLEEARTGARQVFIHKDPDGLTGDPTEFFDDLNEEQSKDFDKNFKVIGRDASDGYTPDGLYAVSHFYDGNDRIAVEMTLEEPAANQNKLEYLLKRTLYDPEIRKQGKGNWIPVAGDSELRSIINIGKDGKYELMYELRNAQGNIILTEEQFKKEFK